MSNPLPPGIQPPGYPYMPQKRGPSCWAVGGIGCLIVFILGAILIFLSVNKVLHSKEGRAFLKSAGTAINTSYAGGVCAPQLLEIQKAIVRYHEHEGKYPDNLKALTPKYLPTGVSLHCGVDKVDDPSHVTYTYFKPTETTPGTAILLSYSWTYSFVIGTQNQTQTMTEQITLNGTTSQVESPSTTMSVTPTK